MWSILERQAADASEVAADIADFFFSLACYGIPRVGCAVLACFYIFDVNLRVQVDVNVNAQAPQNFQDFDENAVEQIGLVPEDEPSRQLHLVKQVTINKRAVATVEPNTRSNLSTEGKCQLQWRTHSCGELSSAHAGTSVVLCGWLDFKRLDRFAVLRDAYGSIQLNIEDRNLWDSVIAAAPLESVLLARGQVRLRPEKMVNEKMKTGDIEVVPSKVRLLNAVTLSLPFETSDRPKTAIRDETTRLKNRHLDLRRDEMQRALRFRSTLLHRLRCALVDLDFVDVETPTLFRRTPGGAAEFPVPAGGGNRFYSLPQSPQQFKQLLMVSGIDRYFQVARCYRNEKSTPDRQPEFTQLDIEMSFVHREQVMRVVEMALCEAGIGANASKCDEISAPFRRMQFDDAMKWYGTDKPDLRFDMRIVDVSHVLRETFPFNGARNVSCLVLPANVAEIVSSTQMRRWRKDLQNRENMAHFDLCHPTENNKDGPKFRGALKHANVDILHWLCKSKSAIYANFDLHSGQAICVAWGESAEKVQKTLGVLRLRFADAAEKNHRSIRKRGNEFLWVVDFPLFTVNEITGEMESTHHPFTAPVANHMHLIHDLKNWPLITGDHFDLVLNGTELGGGSIRIHDAEMQHFVLEGLGCDSKEMGHLLRALRHGAPPHGGFALGVDRYVATLLGKPSIREVIAFPKTLDGNDLMCGAPVPLNDEKLKIYGLKCA